MPYSDRDWTRPQTYRAIVIFFDLRRAGFSEFFCPLFDSGLPARVVMDRLLTSVLYVQ
jgi:hypothetical protein